MITFCQFKIADIFFLQIHAEHNSQGSNAFRLVRCGASEAFRKRSIRILH